VRLANGRIQRGTVPGSAPGAPRTRIDRSAGSALATAERTPASVTARPKVLSPARRATAHHATTAAAISRPAAARIRRKITDVMVSRTARDHGTSAMIEVTSS